MGVTVSPIESGLRVKWDPVGDIDIAGYRVYYGEAQDALTEFLDAGASTSVDIRGLINGKTYYRAVSAYDEGGLKELSQM